MLRREFLLYFKSIRHIQTYDAYWMTKICTLLKIIEVLIHLKSCEGYNTQRIQIIDFNWAETGTLSDKMQ